jgi:hypothetical protein
MTPTRTIVMFWCLACGPSRAGHDGDGGGGGDTDGGASHDGAGEADTDGNDYDGCVGWEFYFSDVNRDCEGGAFGATVPDSCSACSCASECSRDSDCSSPRGGNAVPDCRDGACVLRCDADTTCPEGMRCGALNADDSPICADVLDDPLACGAINWDATWPNPCVSITDEASCETLVSEYGYACKWATVSLYQVPADDCVPIETTQECILTAQGDFPDESGACQQPAYCEATGTRVYFEDVGGGTVRLYSYEDCQPRMDPRIDTQGNPVDFCDYSGAVPLPLVCECGCQEPGADSGTSG